MYYFLNSNKMLFLFVLFFSTLISISSNSWIGCWIGLEINLLSFIPLISNTKNLLSSETSLKYFLIQSIASINFLFIILLNMYSLMNFNSNILNMILLNSPILMKLGSAPFHFWFPNIIEGLSWLNCFILMTWQKITPMILLSYSYNFNFLIFIIILNSIIGALGGISQSSLRKIMSFSSINNLSWMILAIMISENLWMNYFLIYFLLNFIICFMFYLLNLLYYNQLFFFNLKLNIKMLLLLNFLSLGGLPPFLGFMPKWMMINFLMFNKMFLINFILIMMSLILLFFYTRIMFSSLLFNHFKFKWLKSNMKLNLFNKINLLIFFSLMGLPLSTFLLYF
uniref:NADH dehydrogenase subunit 2 n=1 Tax=Phyllonorycter ringoniella TaxID=571297 RepID=UPI001FA7735A|nr:NADH dehydrogenase subunit 2 [Phyllonorycter ringoniella]ULF47722.1 NADH dehydrogenase subunit 2 [Phyllonorycter ringoniella]